MKVLVVLSGGQDSSTCLALALEAMEVGHVSEVRAVTFDYGQRHAREVQQACAMIAALAEQGVRVRHEVIAAPVLVGASPLVNKAQQVESYESAAVLPGGLEKTFVPLRNLLFLTIAANRAVAMGLEGAAPERVVIYTGVSQEDYGGYPDCREVFMDTAQSAIGRALDSEGLPLIVLRAPLLFKTKKETVELAEKTRWGRPLNALSHTCYNGAHPPCGTCHACLLRAQGYGQAGVVDPILEAATT